MMDIDPLGQVQSSASFFPPPPSLSAERMHQYHHDPLSVFPRPGYLAHPRPIKVEPHNRRVSLEEGRPTPPEEEKEEKEEEVRQPVSGEGEVKEAPKSPSTPASQPEKSPEKETTTESPPSPRERNEDEKDACEALRALGERQQEKDGEEAISYQCNLCDFRDGVLSGLTWHLECQHSLTHYSLIKTLMACLGDIAE